MLLEEVNARLLTASLWAGVWDLQAPVTRLCTMMLLSQQPSTRVHAAAAACGLAERFRRTEAVIVEMRHLRLEHGWDKYISLEPPRRDLLDRLITCSSKKLS